jgi:polysaccharide deacetylase 2 family uncharacterized protein YibQ
VPRRRRTSFLARLLAALGPRTRLAVAALAGAAICAGIVYWSWPTEHLRRPLPPPNAHIATHIPRHTPPPIAVPSPPRQAEAIPKPPPHEPAVLPEPAPAIPPLAATPGPAGRGRIAIVIDDIGPALADSERALRLPAAITMSVLPYAKHAAELAAEARQRGHEILVHMPMQPIGHLDPGPNALLTGLSPAEFARRLDWNLTRFDGYVGVNNHMGSRLTTDPALMRTVLLALRQRGVFYLDSRTIAGSVGMELAKRLGVPALGRNVFLDNQMTPAAVCHQLAVTEAYAERHGSVIAIGHPHPVTVAVLEQWVEDVSNRGFTLAPITALLPAPAVAQAIPSARCDGGQHGADGGRVGACVAQGGQASGAVALGEPPADAVPHQRMVVPGR